MSPNLGPVKKLNRDFLVEKFLSKNFFFKVYILVKKSSPRNIFLGPILFCMKKQWF